MKLYLNEKIKKLRLANDWTQEQLAERLDVSTQAVSRWETNSTFPDIELLPDIAIIFDISVDELLGVNDSINHNRVEKCIEEANHYYASGNIKKMIEILEKGIHENPTNVKLLLNLVVTLFSFYDDDRKNTCRRIIDLGNKIIDRVKDVDDKCSLYQIMAYTHFELGNVEQAMVFANKLPSMAYSKEFILSSIVDAKERDKYIQYNIETLFTNLITQMKKLSNSKQYSLEDKICILNKANQLYSIMYEKEDFGYENYLLSKINMEIFKLNLELKKEKDACTYLRKAFKYAQEFDYLKGDFIHCSLLNNQTKFNKEENFGKDYKETEVEKIIQEVKKLNLNDFVLIQENIKNLEGSF
jgi:transcriptional regulator with XRE-family HTH domain